MRPSFVRLFIVVAVAIPSLALAFPALAQYPPTETDTTPDASFACEGLTAGGTATCSIGGWQAGSEVSVTVTADETVVLSESVTADEAGFIGYEFEVPADADNLAFTHAGILLDGTPATHTEVLAAAAPAGGDTDGAAPDGLATTGEMVSLLMLAAVLALALGVVAVRRGRTREAATRA